MCQAVGNRPGTPSPKGIIEISNSLAEHTLNAKGVAQQEPSNSEGGVQEADHGGSEWGGGLVDLA